MNFVEVGFADDLNTFKAYARIVSNDAILQNLTEAQNELHSWGAANSVTFDAAKE